MLKTYVYDRGENKVSFVSSIESIFPVEKGSSDLKDYPQRDKSQPVILTHFHNNAELRYRIKLPGDKNPIDLVAKFGEDKFASSGKWSYLYLKAARTCVICVHPEKQKVTIQMLVLDLTTILQTCNLEPVKQLVTPFLACSQELEFTIPKNQLNLGNLTNLSSEDTLDEAGMSTGDLKHFTKTALKNFKVLDDRAIQEIIAIIMTELQKRSSFEDRLSFLYNFANSFFEKDFNIPRDYRWSKKATEQDKQEYWMKSILMIDETKKNTETITKLMLMSQGSLNIQSISYLIEDPNLIGKLGYIMVNNTARCFLIEKLITTIQIDSYDATYIKFVTQLVSCCQNKGSSLLHYIYAWWEVLSQKRDLTGLVKIFELLHLKPFAEFKSALEKETRLYLMFEVCFIAEYTKTQNRSEILEKFIIPLYKKSFRKLELFYNALMEHLKQNSYSDYDLLSDDEIIRFMTSELIQLHFKRDLVLKYMVPRFNNKKRADMVHNFFKTPYPYFVKANECYFSLEKFLQNTDRLLIDLQDSENWNADLASEVESVSLSDKKDCSEICFELMQNANKNYLIYRLIDLLNNYLQKEGENQNLSSAKRTILYKAILLMRDFTKDKVTKDLAIQDITEMHKAAEASKNSKYNLQFMNKFKQQGMPDVKAHVLQQYSRYQNIQKALANMRNIIDTFNNELQVLANKYQLTRLMDCINTSKKIQKSLETFTVEEIEKMSDFEHIKLANLQDIKLMIDCSKFSHAHKYLADFVPQDLLSMQSINEHSRRVFDQLKEEVHGYLHDSLTLNTYRERLSNMKEELLDFLKVSPGDKTELKKRISNFRTFQNILEMIEQTNKGPSFAPLNLLTWMNKNSSLMDRLNQLYNKITPLDCDSLVYNEMTDLVGAELLENKITQLTRGTIFVSLSHCQKLLVFMKETDQGWINDLQGEGDQESISLASELKTAYEQLGFMMDAASLSGDDLVSKISELYINDPLSDERYERLSKKLDYIIDLKQKVSGEHLKIMNSIKEDSTIVFEFDDKNNEKDREDRGFNIYKYEASLKTSDGRPNTYSMNDLNDYITKSYILCKELKSRSENLGRDGVEAVENNLVYKDMLEFKTLGDFIKSIYANLMKMYQLGLIHHKITTDIDILSSIIKDCSAEHLIKIEDNKLLLAVKMKEAEYAEKINSFSTALTDTYRSYREKYVEAILTNHPLTYFYCGRLYHLFLMIRHKKPDQDTVSLLADIVYPNTCDPDTVAAVFQDCPKLHHYDEIRSFLDDLRSKCATASGSVQNKISSGTFLSPNLISVVHLAGEAKDAKPGRSQETNKYDVLLKLMLKMKFNKINQSQLLYCRTDLNEIEMIAFVSRALTDSTKRCYFVMNISNLSEEMIQVMNREIRRKIHGQVRDGRDRIVVFDDTSDRLLKPYSDLYEYINPDSIEAFLKKTNNDQDAPYLAKYIEVLENTLVVTSEEACGGKTTFIKNLHKADLAQKKTVDLLVINFTGDINEEVLLDRLNMLSSVLDKHDKFDICLQLDYLSDIHLHKDLIDCFLFSLIFMRNYLTARGICNLSKHINKIYIEIGNSIQSQLNNSIDIIKCLNKWHVAEKANKYCIKFVECLTAFDPKNLVLDTSPASTASKTCKYLQMFDAFIEKQASLAKQASSKQQNQSKDMTDKEISEKPGYQISEATETSFPKTDLTTKLTPEEMRKLIQKHFTLPHKSYSSFNLWSLVISKLKDDLDSCEVLNEQKQKDALGKHVTVRLLREETCSLILTSAEHIIKMHGSFMKTQKKMIEFYVRYDEINKMSSEEDIQKFRDSLFAGLTTDKDVLEEQDSNFSKNDLYLPLMSQQAFFPVTNGNTLANLKSSGKQVTFTTQFLKFHSSMFNKMYSSISNQRSLNHMWYLYCMSLCVPDEDGVPWTIEALIRAAKSFDNKKGYSLTEQTFCKLTFMIFKSQLKDPHPLPIIIMGESGCGKTYLCRFLAIQLMASAEANFNHITLHEGFPEIEVIRRMNKIIGDAEAAPTKKFWVFFDEFNTTAIQSMVADMMIDRLVLVPSKDAQVKQQVRIPTNVYFIACCNPYQIKMKKTRDDVGLIPPKKSALLSHNVHPIPARLLSIVWNFGSLTTEDEKDHIKSMVRAERIFSKSEADLKKQIVKENKLAMLFFYAHMKVRNIEDKSGVSLRDVKRVLTFYKWFKQEISRLRLIVHPSAAERHPSDIEETIKCVREEDFWFLRSQQTAEVAAGICSVMLCYGLRLNGREEPKSQFLKKVSEWCQVYGGLEAPSEDQVASTFEDLAHIYIEFIDKSFRRDVTSNTALKENFLSILASYDNRIPVIVVGSPGTSKTLTTNLFIDLISKKQPNNPVYKKFFALKVFNFGGSETSKPEGLLRVFELAKKYYETEHQPAKLEKAEPCLPVIFFDELGLAELSKYNPLKAIHEKLENNVGKIPFIAISNWLPDQSKLNRMVCLWRPDLTETDLKDFFKSTIEQTFKPKLNSKDFTFDNLQQRLSALSAVYIKYRKFQRATGALNGKYRGYNPMFHGSRDIYGAFKFIFASLNSMSDLHPIRTLDQSKDPAKKKQLNETINLMVASAIERNINGEAYTFGDSFNPKKNNVIDINELQLDPHLIPKPDSASNPFEETGPQQSCLTLSSLFTDEFIENHRLVRMDDFAEIYQETSNPNDAADYQRQKAEGSGSSFHISLTSSEVIKLLFYNHILAEDLDWQASSISDRKNRLSSLVTDRGVVEIIKDNILNNMFELDAGNKKVQDKCRYMLIRTETDMVEQILIDILKEKLKSQGIDNIIDMRHASKLKSIDEQISEIKTHVSIGSIVLMKDMDEVYGGLYDLFNQKFTEGHNKQLSCLLYFGENKQKVTVHENFRCIVFKHSSHSLKSSLKSDIHLPPPFLNRFEKYLPQLSGMLLPGHIKNIHKMRRDSTKLSDRKSSVMLCLGLDMFTSIALKGEDFMNPFFEPISDDEINKKLVRISTWNILLSKELTKKVVTHFEKSREGVSLAQQLQENRISVFKKILLTFTNISYFTERLETDNPEAYQLYKEYQAIHMMEDIAEDMQRIKSAALTYVPSWTSTMMRATRQRPTPRTRIIPTK